jgi:hypothetical protein
LLVGRFRRLTNWEFWPLQIFYAPVFLYVIWLGLRFRNLTAFASANPAFPAGGFKGESKNDIYRLVASSSEAAGHLLRHSMIPADLGEDEKLAIAEGFIESANLSFPIVIKPDAGERGLGVEIVRDLARLAQVISGTKSPLIIQEFAEGVEASVFYYRFPNRDNGEVFSITKKLFPEVVGDGQSTIEELILRDSRAVAMAEKYFEQNASELLRVPGEGELFSLIDIGTHSRGAVFLDGGHLLTPGLEDRIDAVCHGIDGFYFGRFDLRSGSIEELKAGRFKIIELNGVTSESTNIYDPRFTLFEAYRILFRQWRIAFEIGLMNISLGAHTVTIRDLLRLAFGRSAKKKEPCSEAQCAL